MTYNTNNKQYYSYFNYLIILLLTYWEGNSIEKVNNFSQLKRDAIFAKK